MMASARLLVASVSGCAFRSLYAVSSACTLSMTVAAPHSVWNGLPRSWLPLMASLSSP